MFKKIIMAILAAGLLLCLGKEASAQDFATLLSSGYAKRLAKEYVAARTDFQSALTLAVNDEERASAQLQIAISYEDQQNYPQMKIELAKVLALPDIKVMTRCDAQLRLSNCYLGEKEYARAREEYKKVLAVKSEEKDLGSAYWKTLAQYQIGLSYELEKNYTQAVVEYQKVIDMPKATSSWKSSAQFEIGVCYEMQNKTKKAQDAFATLCLKYASSGTLGIVKEGFNRIDPVQLGRDKYLEVLNTLLLSVKATAANAEFLGYIKSEIEKLKLK